MLKPQANPYRQISQMASFWDFRFDFEDNGKSKGWVKGFDQAEPIAVPASWNDQFAEGRDNLGPAWYQTHFDLPWDWDEQRILLRFNSVNYLAEVWLNGDFVGSHEGGHLPFDLDISQIVQKEGNLLVVRVDGRLAPEHVPPGNIPPIPGQDFPARNFPAANFDFYPYCGIQRPVILYTQPKDGITELAVVTDIAGSTGMVSISIATQEDRSSVEAVATLSGFGSETTASGLLDKAKTLLLSIPGAKLWSPQEPNLYKLVVELKCKGTTFDRYTLDVGIRTIKVAGDRLLLNDQPVFLKGFGRHEDFPITGRGWVPAVMVKDFEIMKWVGANSFRTTHYPYAEETMELADRLGFMVIDETPAVGLFFHEPGLEARRQLCQQFTRELVERDRNHPSVILWSLANEPHSIDPEAKTYFRGLYDLARSLDPTRPVTVVSSVGASESAFEYLDVVCLNRYYGWYVDSGQLGTGIGHLADELDKLHALFPKPLILTEFGADTIPGVHAQPPEMFSEEYQAEMLEQYIQLLNSRPYVVGQHVWNLCDFKTAQAVIRMGGINYKGVFTRDRKPKLAAHRLKALWSSGE